MSCVPCQIAAQQAAIEEQVKVNQSLGSVDANCRFTELQMLEWKRLLLYVKRSDYITLLNTDIGTINRGLGMIGSALNHSYNICYFEKYLSEFEPLIFQIVNQALCP